MEIMKPEEIVELFKGKFGDSITESKIESKSEGVKKNSYSSIWLTVKLENFKEVVKLLGTIQFPHFAIISGDDLGEEIELIYHFSLYYGERFKEISINIITLLPKKNLKIPTLTDLIPGTQTAEREIKEMFGIKIEGLPDSPNLFLPVNFAKEIYPFRRDEKGIYPLSKNGNYVGDNIVKREEEVKKVE
ncbi:MAG: NADH-quinone oxidoreductase subunit C [Candidatus Caldatribacteriota bacterium]|nr:NADH-quinone oxidoreductase subunit C [Candidatus Caldatribacteriota bacterium]